MSDDRDKTISFGAFDGREEYEANLRRKIVSFLSHFRTQAEVENFLFDIERMRSEWKELTATVERIDKAQEEMIEASERRTWLAQSITAFLKWTAIAGGGVAAIKVFWEAFKSSVGGGSP